MNEETRTILYALKWIIERHNFTPDLRDAMNEDICAKMTDLVAPLKEQPTIAERTHDALSELNVGGEN